VASEGSGWTGLGEVGWPGREASGVNGGKQCSAARQGGWPNLVARH
jgi:hypothetical protein